VKAEQFQDGIAWGARLPACDPGGHSSAECGFEDQSVDGERLVLLSLMPSRNLCLSCLYILALLLIEFVNEVDPTLWQRFVQRDIKALLQCRTQARCNGWLLHCRLPA